MPICVLSCVVTAAKLNVPSYAEPKAYQTEQHQPASAPVPNQQYNPAVQQPAYYPVRTNLKLALKFCVVGPNTVFDGIFLGLEIVFASLMFNRFFNDAARFIPPGAQ